MTKDRVIFTLDGLTMKGADMKGLLSSVFGLLYSPKAEYDGLEDIDIICRLDQFAQFIIGRNDIGLTNIIKGLQAKIIPDPSQPARRTFNVSEYKFKEPLQCRLTK